MADRSRRNAQDLIRAVTLTTPTAGAIIIADAPGVASIEPSSFVGKQRANGRWVRTLGFAGLVVACVHLTCFRSDPTGTLAGIDSAHNRGHTDHVAHIGETRIFPRLGLELWQTPAVTLFRRLTPDEIARLPADVKAHTLAFPKDMHFVPGYPADRPLVMNFAHVPRCYPPGVFLLGAPSALLYHYGLTSFGASNRQVA